MMNNKFIYSILLALLWVGITITLGSYLYRMGLPVVNASAQNSCCGQLMKIWNIDSEN